LFVAELRTPSEAFAEAVDSIGGQGATGRLVGVTQGAIWQRLKAKKPAAAGWVLKLEAATGIPKEQLRPDIYGPVDNLANLEPQR
jgi:DNA-binding transcriptional regulator YdaS (Cro superfamily)